MDLNNIELKGLTAIQNNLLRHVMKSANQFIVEGMELTPVAFLMAGTDVQMVAGVFSSDEVKDRFAREVRTTAEKMRAEFCIFVSEAWVLMFTKEIGERYVKNPNFVRPKDHPNRVECALFHVENLEKVWNVRCSIIREPKPLMGKPESAELEISALGGRFMTFLPKLKGGSNE